MQWIWCFIGLLVFRKSSNNYLNVRKNRKYVFWFILIMILSTLSPYFEYNQNIINTLISQRYNYSIAVLLILFYIHPTPRDLFDTIYKLTIITLLLFMYSLIDLSFFIPEEAVERRLDFESNDVGISILVPGFMLAVVYFFYLADLLISSKQKMSINLIKLFLLLIFIILVQSRQTLIFIIPIFIFTIFKIKNTLNKLFLNLIFTAVLVSFGSYIFLLLEGLVGETFDQLGDNDYNRFQSLEVFLGEWEYNIFNLFFGHGVGSINSEYTNTLVNVASQRGAYLQDIGFLGSFFFYGSLFLIINYYLIFQGFFRKYMPYYIKFWCFTLILLPNYLNWGMMSNSSSVFG